MAHEFHLIRFTFQSQKQASAAARRIRDAARRAHQDLDPLLACVVHVRKEWGRPSVMVMADVPVDPSSPIPFADQTRANVAAIAGHIARMVNDEGVGVECLTI